MTYFALVPLSLALKGGNRSLKKQQKNAVFEK